MCIRDRPCAAVQGNERTWLKGKVQHGSASDVSHNAWAGRIYACTFGKFNIGHGPLEIEIRWQR